jgi:hypothetical protein
MMLCVIRVSIKFSGGKSMKKLVSAMIVLAMVLAMLPMVVLANPGTYDLSVGFAEYVELYADDVVTLNVTAGDKDLFLTVSGEGTYYEWYLDNGMQMFWPDISCTYKMKLQAGQSYELQLVSDTSFDDQYLYVTLTAPEVGDEENPADLNMGENSVSVDGIEPYFFGFTATEAGQLTVSIDTAKCSDWSFQLKGKLANGNMVYGDTNYSDVTPVVSSQTVTVNAGDQYLVCVNTANMGTMGTIYFNASFTPGVPGGDGEGDGSEGGNEGDLPGTVVDSATVKINSASATVDNLRVKVVEFTAVEEGTVYIKMSSTDKGWSLLVYKNGEALTWMMTGAEDQVFEYPVMPGDVLKFEMGAYDEQDWTVVDGKITYVISFDAGEVEIEKEEYIISDTSLFLGDNDLAMIDNALNSLFEFIPEETGVYLFTAPNGALIGEWGQFFNPNDVTGDNKTNTIQWTCTAVGQSVLIGVAGEDDIVLNVERTADYVPEPEIEWIIYKNTAYLDYFMLDPNADLMSVDVMDDIPDIAVLGADGYYHLGTANGPILFIDLNQYIYPATGYGKVTHIVYDSEGNVVERVNYTDAIIEYYGYTDGGIYPLTADLIAFYKNYGNEQGWYDPNQSMGFYLFGEDVVDPETAWMFACYYDENITAMMSEYYVAGESGLCGSNWDPSDAANQMIMNADGTISITYNDVAPGKYMFKVTQGDWDLDSWGGNGPDGNFVIELKTQTYVTIKFDPATGNISVITGENADSGDYSMAALVVAMMAATAGAVLLTKKKEY